MSCSILIHAIHKSKLAIRRNRAENYQPYHLAKMKNNCLTQFVACLFRRRQHLNADGAMRFCLLLTFLVAVVFLTPALAAPLRLQPADSPVDNPMKGLVPYAGQSAERFPHSLEFDYLPLSKLLTGPGQYNWQSLDDKLVVISRHSCQAVFRVWLEYPGQLSGLPDYLVKAGVKVTEWKDEKEKRPQKNFTPDYEDERLVVALEGFFTATQKAG